MIPRIRAGPRGPTTAVSLACRLVSGAAVRQAGAVKGKGKAAVATARAASSSAAFASSAASQEQTTQVYSFASSSRVKVEDLDAEMQRRRGAARPSTSSAQGRPRASRSAPHPASYLAWKHADSSIRETAEHSDELEPERRERVGVRVASAPELEARLVQQILTLRSTYHLTPPQHLLSSHRHRLASSSHEVHPPGPIDTLRALSSPFNLVAELLSDRFAGCLAPTADPADDQRQRRRRTLHHTLQRVEDEPLRWSMLVEGLTRLTLQALSSVHFRAAPGRSVICEWLLLLNVSDAEGMRRDREQQQAKREHGQGQGQGYRGRLHELEQAMRAQAGIRLGSASYSTAIAHALLLQHTADVQQLIDCAQSDVSASRHVLGEWTAAVQERMQQDPSFCDEGERAREEHPAGSGLAEERDEDDLGATIRAAMDLIASRPQQAQNAAWQRMLLGDIVSELGTEARDQLAKATRRLRLRASAGRGNTRLLDQLQTELRGEADSSRKQHSVDASVSTPDLALDSALRWMRETTAVRPGTDIAVGTDFAALQEAAYSHPEGRSGEADGDGVPLRQPTEHGSAPSRSAAAIQRARRKRRTKSIRCATSVLQIRRWTLGEGDLSSAEQVLADLLGRRIPVTHAHVEPFISALCAAGRIRDALRVQAEASSRLALPPSRKMRAALIAAMIVAEDVGGACAEADALLGALAATSSSAGTARAGWDDALLRIEANFTAWHRKLEVTAAQEQLFAHLRALDPRQRIMLNQAIVTQRLTLLSRMGYALEAQQWLARALDAGVKTDADMSTASQRAGMRLRRELRSIVLADPEAFSPARDSGADPAGRADDAPRSRRRSAEDARNKALVHALDLHLDNRRRIALQRPRGRRSEPLRMRPPRNPSAAPAAHAHISSDRLMRRRIFDLLERLGHIRGTL